MHINNVECFFRLYTIYILPHYDVARIAYIIEKFHLSSLSRNPERRFSIDNEIIVLI